MVATLLMGAIGTMSGCGKQSNEAIKPDTFAPPPKGDSPAGGGASQSTATAEG